jgi:nicotinate-nucleotide adenylyltransferase
LITKSSDVRRIDTAHVSWKPGFFLTDALMTSGRKTKALPGLGILGGTFDPIHNGHLIAAQALLEKLHLSKILFLISAHPPHKSSDELSPWDDRLQMVALAIQDNERFKLSEVERKRTGPSYTFETMKTLQTRYGRRFRLHFIVGADSILEIFTWRQPERLLDSGALVVIPRPGFDLGKLDRKVKEKVTIVQTPLVEISSSDIRRRVRQRRSIRYLVPQEVENYIRRSKLYRRSCS